MNYYISSAVKSNFSFNLAKDCIHQIYQMSVIYLCFMRNSSHTVYQMSYSCLKMLQVIMSLLTRSSKQPLHKQGLERRDIFRTGHLFYWYTHTRHWSRMSPLAVTSSFFVNFCTVLFLCFKHTCTYVWAIKWIFRLMASLNPCWHYIFLLLLLYVLGSSSRRPLQLVKRPQQCSICVLWVVK